MRNWRRYVFKVLRQVWPWAAGKWWRWSITRAWEDRPAPIVALLREMTGRDPIELLEAAGAEAKRMRAEGLIVDYVTPFGTLTVMRHPLLRLSNSDGSRPTRPYRPPC
jgi:hypothetical protein